jgi:hypothetical protein
MQGEGSPLTCKLPYRRSIPLHFSACSKMLQSQPHGMRQSSKMLCRMPRENRGRRIRQLGLSYTPGCPKIQPLNKHLKSNCFSCPHNF